MNKEIEYNIAHLDLFNIEDDVELLKIETEYNNDAITIIIDGRPIISTGIRLVNKNTGDIWMIKNEYISQHKIYIIKRLEELINFYANKYKLTRIQTTIVPKNVKWIENLGFEKESELVGFSEEPTFIYRRNFKWE